MQIQFPPYNDVVVRIRFESALAQWHTWLAFEKQLGFRSIPADHTRVVVLFKLLICLILILRYDENTPRVLVVRKCSESNVDKFLCQKEGRIDHDVMASQHFCLYQDI